MYKKEMVSALMIDLLDKGVLSVDLDKLATEIKSAVQQKNDPAPGATEPIEQIKERLEFLRMLRDSEYTVAGRLAKLLLGKAFNVLNIFKKNG